MGRRAVLAAIHDYLEENIRCAPTLEQTAGAFGLSPATLKRRLARHGSHFSRNWTRCALTYRCVCCIEDTITMPLRAIWAFTMQTTFAARSSAGPV